jgi:hypothetical protein
MRPALWTLPAACVVLASCKAIPDHEPHREPRFAARAPLPLVAPPNTLARAGNSDTVAPWAIPGVTRYEAGGYVGGGSLKSSQPLRRSTAAVGAPGDGTFGLDFVGFRHRPGRVFLAPSPDPSDGVPIADNYKTDVVFPKDVFNIRPVRKAVLERREERDHGGEGHE